jgi:allene oxide cyclase-like protein
MRRTLRLTAIVALVLAAVGVTVAAASSPGRDGEHGGVQVISAERITPPGGDVPIGGADDIGDQVIFTANFVVDGKQIGFDGGFCTLVRKPAWFQCVATNVFENGQITAQGLNDFSFEEGKGPPEHYAITGGTGAYRTAHGEVELINRAGPNDHVTFTIITSDE